MSNDMNHVHVITRRGFLDRGTKIALGSALATLTDLPFVLKRALAEGSIGGNGKKLLFIWLRGGNDALNSVVPILDPAYNSSNRPTTFLPNDPATDYSQSNIAADFPVNSTAGAATFSYNFAIRLGNGFAAMHPSLKFLAPVYNAGDLALISRVGYPRQSRSHFDSQNYWENGTPNSNFTTDGIFYRTMVQSILNGTARSPGLTGVSIQSALPLILRGSAAAMTNLTDPTRYDLLGIPNNSTGANTKAFGAVTNANTFPYPSKLSRQLLDLQYKNLTSTLQTFAGINFTDFTPGTAGDGNAFVDDANTDGDVAPYYLFPTMNQKNGGAYMNGRTNDSTKYAVPTSAYSFFTNLKAAALILNLTDAILTGTEFGGFDTHNAEGGTVGAHANLQRQIAWALYGLRKFFLIYGKGGTNPLPGAQVGWNDVVVVTLSEFGRTSIENTSAGTDHAEAGAMFVAGGAVKGRGKSGATTGVFGCHTSDSYNGQSVPWVPGPSGAAPANPTGTMFGVVNRYLQRSIDYRSVLGKIIRDHLGASQNQINTIIPGYAVAGEQLLGGGVSSIDGTRIAGEPPFI